MYRGALPLLGAVVCSARRSSDARSALAVLLVVSPRVFAMLNVTAVVVSAASNYMPSRTRLRAMLQHAQALGPIDLTGCMRPEAI